jgi:hypothetical protein
VNKEIKIKSNYWSFLGRILALIMLLLALGFIGFALTKSTESETIHYVFYSIMLLVILLVISITAKEPNALEINFNHLKLRNFPFLWQTKLTRSQIKGYSVSTKTYSADSESLNVTKHPVYILYLTSGKKYHLVSYYFKDFKKIPKLFRAFGVQNLGKEKEGYKLMFFRKYKF